MKVFLGGQNPLLQPIQDDLAVHLEKHNFTIYSDINECNIVPLLHYDAYGTSIDNQMNYIKNLNNKFLILLECYHTADTALYESYISQRLDPYLKYTNRIILLHNNAKINKFPFIFYDIVWNYVKACFIDYDKFDFKNRLWSMNLSKENYHLSNINEIFPDKKFLIPNKVRYSDNLGYNSNSSEDISNRNIFRARLQKIILENDCYFSDPENCIYLEPNYLSEEILNSHFTYGNMGNTPIANYYYKNSIVSVYVETIASNFGGELVSEKTFLPLIKGHFILPFSSPNFLNFLTRQYGFKLPAWIDYSYDQIENDRDRFIGFLRSLSKLRLTPLKKLTELFNNDLDILKHNREIFFSRPYDFWSKKVKNFI